MEINNSTTKNICKIITYALLLYFAILKFDTLLSIGKFVLNLLMPFLIGGAIAFIFSVPMAHIEKFLKNTLKMKKGVRFVSWFITLISIMLVFFIVIFFAVPEIVSTVEIIAKQIEQVYLRIPEIIANIEISIPQLDSLVGTLGIDWQALSQSAIKTLQAFVSSVVASGGSLVAGVASSVTTGILAFIFSLYIIFSKEKLTAAAKKTLSAILPQAKVDYIVYVAKLTNKTFSNFLSGQCLEAVILGTIFVIAMTIFNMPYAMLIGMIVGITALIPIFGAFIGCIIGMFLIVMVSPVKAFWFLIMFLVIQQLENNLIYPYVVGSSIGLPAILMFISVIVGGNLMGILGMLLFIPISSVLYTLAKSYVEKNTHKIDTQPEVLDTTNVQALPKEN